MLDTDILVDVDDSTRRRINEYFNLLEHTKNLGTKNLEEVYGLVRELGHDVSIDDLI